MPRVGAGHPSPAGEGGREAAGWGGQRTTLPTGIPRALRKRMTPQEVKLWNWLRESIVPLGFHFRRQVAIDRFVVDFACLRERVVVELDGEQHGRDPEIVAADSRRDTALAKRGHRVLRFTNSDVDRQKSMVIDTIVAALRGEWGGPHPVPSGPPSPAGEGSSARTKVE